MPGDLPRLPWWEQDDDPALIQAAIEAANEKLQPQKDGLHLFRKRSLLGFTLLANTLERTLPAGFNELATYQLMEELLASPFDCTAKLQCSPTQLWPAEGDGSTAQSRQQLIQFTKAACYLCWPLQPLTVDAVCTAHQLMMWGAVEDGAILPAGKFRSTAAHSGTGYVYPEAGCTPERLSQIVDNFNSSLSSGTVASYQLAADLLYQFVILHPFPNGNGRMCRLLAAYAACAAGVPFMLHLSNGHSNTRQHFHQVLRHADKHGHTLRLQSYIMECLHLQWQNALAFCEALASKC